jgi:hypothetical protein
LIIAVEECESRILKKDKTDGSDMDVDEEKDGEDDSEDSDSVNVDEEKGKKAQKKVPKAQGLSDYEKRRERNIEENKKILAELFKKTPVQEKGQVKGVVTGNKDVIDKALNVTSNATPTVTPNNPEFTNGSLTNSSIHLANEAPQPGAIHVPSAVTAENDSANPIKTAQPANNSLDPGNETPPHIDPKIPTSFPTPQLTTETDAPPSGLARSGDNDVAMDTAHRDGDNSAHTANNSIQPENNSSHRIKTAQPANSLDPGNETPPSQLTTETDAPPSGLSISADNDVAMDDESSGDSTLPEFLNDEDLPTWLVPMIGYLRGITEDVAWQNLVNTFIAFEKQKPANGVSSFSFRFLIVLGS